MHVYRNRKYEEEIVILMWHKKGEQRMIETSKQKTQIQAHHKFTESATQTHTETKQKTTCTGYASRIQGEIVLRAELVKGLGERGLGLVDHVPSGCVAKINIP
jgi:hypothetical protein